MANYIRVRYRLKSIYHIANHCKEHIPVMMRRQPDGVLMLAHRLRRWPSIKTSSGLPYIFWDYVPYSHWVSLTTACLIYCSWFKRKKRKEIKGCGALVERLTASPVMHASRVRTPLILLGFFRKISLCLPSQFDYTITLMAASSS